jgi:hypothetical protein
MGSIVSPYHNHDHAILAPTVSNFPVTPQRRGNVVQVSNVRTKGTGHKNDDDRDGLLPKIP